eukprot:PhF_6_TR23984/c0_g1_i3/m.33588
MFRVTFSPMNRFVVPIKEGPMALIRQYTKKKARATSSARRHSFHPTHKEMVIMRTQNVNKDHGLQNTMYMVDAFGVKVAPGTPSKEQASELGVEFKVEVSVSGNHNSSEYDYPRAVAVQSLRIDESAKRDRSEVSPW